MLRCKLNRKIAIVLPALAIFTMIPGCGSKVTAENYAKVQQGQTEDQVTEILGKPTSSETEKTIIGSGTKDVWKDGDKQITVMFADGKVAVTDKSGL
jgi:hypothetical protein